MRTSNHFSQWETNRSSYVDVSDLPTKVLFLQLSEHFLFANAKLVLTTALLFISSPLACGSATLPIPADVAHELSLAVVGPGVLLENE